MEREGFLDLGISIIKIRHTSQVSKHGAAMASPDKDLQVANAAPIAKLVMGKHSSHWRQIASGTRWIQGGRKIHAESMAAKAYALNWLGEELVSRWRSNLRLRWTDSAPFQARFESRSSRRVSGSES